MKKKIHKKHVSGALFIAGIIASTTAYFHIPHRLTVMIGGDIMLDRNIRLLGEKNGYDSLFSSISSLLEKADIAVANLEGPITSFPTKTIVNGRYTGELTFTFATSSVGALGRSGIDIVSLANNHTSNFGRDGFEQTHTWLDSVGIKWFGNPWNEISNPIAQIAPSSTEVDSTAGMSDLGLDSPIVTHMIRNGIKVAFVGYHAFQPGSKNVISEIKRVASPDTFVIVMPHWGEEYHVQPSESQRLLARAFIDAGADAIIGAHPHVIMDHEIINGVPVYYSLGNLLFDQYFSPEVMKGNIIELQLVQGSGVPKLDKIMVYETHLDRVNGVTLVGEYADK
jgi:gamma-polyglutamate biosynthesis protein CapA